MWMATMLQLLPQSHHLHHHYDNIQLLDLSTMKRMHNLCVPSYQRPLTIQLRLDGINSLWCRGAWKLQLLPPTCNDSYGRVLRRKLLLSLAFYQCSPLHRSFLEPSPHSSLGQRLQASSASDRASLKLPDSRRA